MKVLFVETPLPRDGGRGQFEAGKVYDLPVRSAMHWLDRGVATDDPKRVAAAEAVVDEPVTEKAPFDPAAADADALRAFLAEHDVIAHHRTGEAKLREMALAVVAGAADVVDDTADEAP